MWSRQLHTLNTSGVLIWVQKAHLEPTVTHFEALLGCFVLVWAQRAHLEPTFAHFEHFLGPILEAESQFGADS
jgi:hypothetical protein